MAKLHWQKHPFPLLLYLEWILLGIAILALFSWRPSHHHRHALALYRSVGALLSMAALGAMGLRLPSGSRLVQGLYISIGFSLSWLALLITGGKERVFPALLLIVVIRACLIFPWGGRIVVALIAYACFLSVQLMAIRIRFLGIAYHRPLPPQLLRLPPEQLQSVLLGFTINSALLFGLVLGFVVLLVGAVLAEYQSREKLIIANRRLRQYALMIENQATLQERNRIAREIHDSVGHALTAQSIQLENAALFLEENQDKAANHLQKARQLGKQALASVRQSVATLRNYPLQGRSLAAALEELIAQFQRNTEITVSSSINVPALLSPEITTTLYRIVQEGLTNISKHSQANQVLLNLTQKDQKISLRLKDNGQGFAPAENRTGFGIQGMQERSEALGGTFTLNSKPGIGCQIVVEIPQLGRLQ